MRKPHQTTKMSSRCLTSDRRSSLSQLPSPYSSFIANIHMNNSGGDVAVNDKEPVEEDLNELLLADSRSSTDSVEMEFQSSRSCRNRPVFSLRTIFPPWINSLMNTRSLFRYRPQEGSLLDGNRLKRRSNPGRKVTCLRSIFSWVLYLFAVLGVIQAIILVCGLIIAFSPETTDGRWDSQVYVGDVTQDLNRWPTDSTRDIVPAACHSHNDYWRKVPLFSAIEAGCTGVEADIWLMNDELYVGHKKSALTESRTLRNLYVNPLVELLNNQNPITHFHPQKDDPRNGVFDTDPRQSLVLLIDFKSNGEKTWPHVVSQLSPLRNRGYLSYYDGMRVMNGPITVVATGNAPFDLLIANSTYRDIFFDAPLNEIAEDTQQHSSSRHESTSTANKYNPTNSYFASVSYTKAIGSPVFFQIISNQRLRIRSQIEAAHRHGLKVRYWNTPSWPRSLRNYVWSVLEREGVDYLNVDDLNSATTKDWRHRFWDWWI